MASNRYFDFIYFRISEIYVPLIALIISFILPVHPAKYEFNSIFVHQNTYLFYPILLPGKFSTEYLNMKYTNMYLCKYNGEKKMQILIK